MIHDNEGRRPPLRQDGEALVRIGPLTALPAVLRELGRDPEQLIAEAGFEPAQFTDPDLKISFVAGSRLLARCVAATGCQQLGLRLAEQSPPSSLGVPGFLLQNAPDVGTALRALLRHISLHDQGGVPTLQLRGEVVALGFVIHLLEVEATDQIYDLSTAMCCNIMRGLCGADWNPVQVFLPRAAPHDITRYRRFFRAPISFDSNEAAVMFSSSFLDRRVPGADPLLYRYLEREANELHSRQQMDLIAELRWTIRKLLLMQKCSAVNVAQELGIQQRTLDRRLKEHGTSYRVELEKLRYDMAKQFLSNTRMPLAKIAATLNYADLTSFGHAFKRWSEITPSAWRARNDKG